MKALFKLPWFLKIRSRTGIMKELGMAESELLFSVVQVASVATAAHVYKWELGLSCKNVEAIDEILVVSVSRVSQQRWLTIANLP